MIPKQKVLMDAVAALNKEEQPWEVTVDENSIIAKWKWMDTRFFSIGEVTDEMKNFTFQVTLDDKGRWREMDSSQTKNAKIDMKDGTISLGNSTFQGTSVGKSVTIGFGKNKDTGETGILTSKFDTKLIKTPIREYLKKCGWKKKGLFF